MSSRQEGIRQSSDRRWFYDRRANARAREPLRFYDRLVQDYFSFLVPEGSRVLNVGCGLGDLLAAVKPVRGVGVDFSSSMLIHARKRHPHCEFHLSEALEYGSNEPFDYILLSDLINDVPDVQALFERMLRHAHPRTRLIVNFVNNLWRPVLSLAELVGAKEPSLPQNWLSSDDVKNLLHLAGWELIRSEAKVLWPVRTPLLASLLNRWLRPLPGMRHFCLTIFDIARPRVTASLWQQYRCSVVIPARNEAANIEATLRRVPDMGKATELIVVEGGSADGTWEAIHSAVAHLPARRIIPLKQHSHGKGSAVREGIAAASGDVLFILDADLTVPPEELPKFYELIRSGMAEFVNGVRLVYPISDEAMRFLNMLANKFFGLTFSWIIGQPVKDTLCGTKVLLRSDYERIIRNRAYFGDGDPFGDFDLLFGAAKLNLRILDLPIRYQARTYGRTNIDRWRHGWLLLRMAILATKRLKFI